MHDGIAEGAADGGPEADAEAMAMAGFARKLLVEYPAVLNEASSLSRVAADMRSLVLQLTNQALRTALHWSLTNEGLVWDGQAFTNLSIQSRSLALALSKAATDSGSTTSNPIRLPCNEPRKTCWQVWRVVFEIDEEYTPIKAIGKGAYGIVCSARHVRHPEPVAIKKIGNAFDNLTDARRMLREIKILRCLRHENIIGLLDMMRPVPKERFTDVYLVYDLMDTDLQQIIKSPQPLSSAHCQYFTYQILRGLKYIHSANVLHRDLKPGNMLINSSCHLKICDFGLARTAMAPADNTFMTEYVVTRWYRAPELLLSCDSYGPPIDVWSVGCILAELLGREPLFAGRDYVDSLKLIIGQLAPTGGDLSFINSDKARHYVRMIPVTERLHFRARFPNADALAIDLLERMLCFDPRKRISVADALRHPWLADLHDADNEPCSPVKFEFDEEGLTREEHVRDAVFNEISSLHPAAAPPG